MKTNYRNVKCQHQALFRLASTFEREVLKHNAPCKGYKALEVFKKNKYKYPYGVGISEYKIGHRKDVWLEGL